MRRCRIGWDRRKWGGVSPREAGNIGAICDVERDGFSSETRQIKYCDHLVPSRDHIDSAPSESPREGVDGISDLLGGGVALAHSPGGAGGTERPTRRYPWRSRLSNTLIGYEHCQLKVIAGCDGRIRPGNYSCFACCEL
jgi:hypothetical protein